MRPGTVRVDFAGIHQVGNLLLKPRARVQKDAFAARRTNLQMTVDGLVQFVVKFAGEELLAIQPDVVAGELTGTGVGRVHHDQHVVVAGEQTQHEDHCHGDGSLHSLRAVTAAKMGHKLPDLAVPTRLPTTG